MISYHNLQIKKKKPLTVYSEWIAMDGYESYEKEETKTLDTCRLNKCH